MINVIGDAMQDEYLWGTSTRQSPEAPVPIVSIERAEKRLGGAANVAANIKAMGCDVECVYGKGKRIRKVRVYAGASQVARIDYDYPQRPITPDSIAGAVERCDLIIAIDYGKGSLANIQDLIQACGAKPVLIDPKGCDYERYRGAALVKPNRDEMREMVGGWSTQAELDTKAHDLIAKAGIGALLLTRAEEGMTLYTERATLHQPSHNPRPVDVSGAGEATLAAYAVALTRGHDRADRLRYASKAAGIAISRQGTNVVTAEELWN